MRHLNRGGKTKRLGWRKVLTSVKPTFCNLSVSLGHALSLDQLVNCLAHSCFYQPRNIAKLNLTESVAETEMIILVFISSRLDYYSHLSTHCN